MTNVFLDASVIIAGLYSQSGGSALILKLAKTGKITGLTSRTVIQEVHRNIMDKMPQNISGYANFIKSSQVTIIDRPDDKNVTRWYSVIEQKDAHVLASGKVSKADYLVTLDRKHFMLEQVKKSVPFIIVTPKELIEILVIK